MWEIMLPDERTVTVPVAISDGAGCLMVWLVEGSPGVADVILSPSAWIAYRRVGET